jgi:hypothetical protein
MGRASRRAVIVVAAGVLAVGLGGMTATGATATAPTTGRASAALTLSSNPVLFGVSAVSRSDAWAVGRQNSTGVFKTLIMHWNGAAWSKVNSPSPSLSDAELLGVSAVSGSNAWAVGWYWNRTGTATDTLILHWNGTAWTQVKSPNPSAASPGANSLDGVSARSGSDAWAVGDYLANDGLSHALIVHWNGTAWTQVNSPTAPRYTDFGLTGVSAVSGSDAWAVGVHGVPSDGGKSGTLIFHWDGVVWTRAKSPNPGSGTNLLEGVSAVSGSDAWAVGNYSSYLNPGASRTLVLHWNGTAWSRVNSPTPNSVDVNFLYGVSARSGSDAWAVGFYWNGTAGAYDSLTLHWNGTAWSRIKSPNPGRFANHLYGVSARSGSDAWAVGYHDTTVSTTNSLILHWNGTSWAKSPPPK